MNFIKNQISDSGFAVFNSDTLICQKFGRILRTEAKLWEMVDTLVWSHDAREKHKQ